jgi:hypothetical protein
MQQLCTACFKYGIFNPPKSHECDLKKRKNINFAVIFSEKSYLGKTASYHINRKQNKAQCCKQHNNKELTIATVYH